jgi:hypothetical protein
MIQRLLKYAVSLSAGVCTIDAQVCAVHVQTGIAGQERDGAHEVLGAAHLTDRNQGSPLLLKLWVVIKDLLGAARL